MLPSMCQVHVAADRDMRALAGLQARVGHLQAGLQAADPAHWQAQRTNRAIVEYLFRTGRFETACAVARQYGIEVNRQLFC